MESQNTVNIKSLGSLNPVAMGSQNTVNIKSLGSLNPVNMHTPHSGVLLVQTPSEYNYTERKLPLLGSLVNMGIQNTVNIKSSGSLNSVKIQH